jgi:hypothetical protein
MSSQVALVYKYVLRGVVCFQGRVFFVLNITNDSKFLTLLSLIFDLVL